MNASQDIARVAQGRWEQILLAAGVDESALARKRRGFPCPGCGGADRFSFYDTEGKGTYNCRAEGGGDGFDLLLHMNPGWSFADAARFVREVTGEGAAPALRKAVDDLASRHASEDDNRRRLQATWDQARPISQGDPVDVYLRGRKIELAGAPDNVRFHPRMNMWARGDGQSKPILVGAFPVMLARFVLEGKMVGLHRTYLSKDGQGKASEIYGCKQLMPGLGYAGAAIPIARIDGADELGLAEGIETGLACGILFGMPVWPTGNRVLLEKVVIPSHVRKVHIFADNDAPDTRGRRAGQESAKRLAERLRAEGRRAVIHLPVRGDMDFAAMLHERKGEAKV
jgi:putative DNA primase/helicase